MQSEPLPLGSPRCAHLEGVVHRYDDSQSCARPDRDSVGKERLLPLMQSLQPARVREDLICHRIR